MVGVMGVKAIIAVVSVVSAVRWQAAMEAPARGMLRRPVGLLPDVITRAARCPEAAGLAGVLPGVQRHAAPTWHDRLEQDVDMQEEAELRRLEGGVEGVQEQP